MTLTNLIIWRACNAKDFLRITIEWKSIWKIKTLLLITCQQFYFHRFSSNILMSKNLSKVSNKLETNQITDKSNIVIDIFWFRIVGKWKWAHPTFQGSRGTKEDLVLCSMGKKITPTSSQKNQNGNDIWRWIVLKFSRFRYFAVVFNS